MLLCLLEGDGNLALTEIAAAAAVVLASGSRYVDGYALRVRAWRGLDLSNRRLRGAGGQSDSGEKEPTGADE